MQTLPITTTQNPSPVSEAIRKNRTAIEAEVGAALMAGHRRIEERLAHAKATLAPLPRWTGGQWEGR